MLVTYFWPGSLKNNKKSKSQKHSALPAKVVVESTSADVLNICGSLDTKYFGLNIEIKSTGCQLSLKLRRFGEGLGGHLYLSELVFSNQ